MIDGAVVVGVAGGAVLPLLMVAACAFTLDQGKLVRASNEGATWLKSKKALCVATVVATEAVFLYEYFANDAGVFAALRWEVIAALVTLAAWSDLKDRVIPNKLVAIALVVGAAIAAAQALSTSSTTATLVDALVGALTGSVVFLVSRLVTKGGVGYGDVKLFGVVGFLAAFKGLFNIMLLSMIAALLVSLIALATKRKKMNDYLPLAPFAFVGVALAVLFGV